MVSISRVYVWWEIVKTKPKKILQRGKQKLKKICWGGQKYHLNFPSSSGKNLGAYFLNGGRQKPGFRATHTLTHDFFFFVQNNHLWNNGNTQRNTHTNNKCFGEWGKYLLGTQTNSLQRFLWSISSVSPILVSHGTSAPVFLSSLKEVGRLRLHLFSYSLLFRLPPTGR